MSNPIKFTITNESITVIHDGRAHTVREGQAQFKLLRHAIQNEQWDEIPKFFSVKSALSQWSNDKFKFDDNGSISYNGEPVPYDFGKKIISMATNGEDPTPLFKFYERLQRNPSSRSVDQLWAFLSKLSIPLTKTGCFLAYKGVRSDYMDRHSGTICNKPGTTITLPRNSISDDPREPCHFGLHVGAWDYASDFAGSGGKLVICEVDPEFVVCVPYDSGYEKMRVCQYKVIGEAGDALRDNVYDIDEVEETKEEDKAAIVEKTINSAKGKPAAQLEIRTKPEKKNFDKYKKWDVSKLLELSIDELRKYATYGLNIVGASKIRGGKTTLVKKILKVRG